MTDTSSRRPSASWALQQWNDALLRAVFAVDNGDDTPVKRMDATDAFLARVAGAPEESATEVRDQFLALFGRSSKGVKRLLDAKCVKRTWDPAADDPNFFATLYMTLIVASATEETHEEGQFRARLETLLRLPPGSYIGQSFPQLWKDLADWTNERANAGLPVRRLLLPNPRHEKIIGYSKRLAFPAFRDLVRLSKVMALEDISAESPIDRILATIGSVKGFSPRFLDEFRVFRSAVENNDAALGQDTPFWGALEAISWTPTGSAPEATPARVRLSLEVGASGQGADLEILLKPGTMEWPSPSWQVRDLPTPLDGTVGFLACAENGDSKVAIRTLLSGSGELEFLIAGTYLKNAIAQGCVCFSAGETLRWVDSRGVPKGGQVRFLMRTDVFEAATRTWTREGVQQPLTTIIDGLPSWVVLEPIGTEELRDWGKLEPFRKLEVFMTTMPLSRIELRGGITLPDGVLFLTPALPRILAQTCDSVEFDSASAETGVGSSGVLEPTPGDPTSGFAFTASNLPKISVPGILKLHALRNGKRVRTRNLNLIATCSAKSRRSPEPFSDWLVGGPTGQLIPAQDQWTTLEDSIPNDLSSVSTTRHVSDRIIRAVGSAESQREECSVTWRQPSEMPNAWRDLLEALSGTLSCRKGMRVQNLLDYVTRAFAIDASLAWSVLDGLTLNRTLRRFFHRRFSGQVLFAQEPGIFSFHETGKSEIRILGLVSHHLRSAICRAARELGLKVEVAVLGDWSAVGCMRITAAGHSEAEELAFRTGMPIREACSVTPASPIDVLSAASPRIDIRQPGVTSEYWISGAFRDVSRSERPEVTMERRRYDRQHANHILWFGETPIWQTQSGRWATLMAHRAIEHAAWQLDSNAVLHINHSVPAIFGLGALAYGDGVSGIDWKAGSAARRLAFRSPVVAHHALGGWLEGSVGQPERSIAITRWATAYAAQHGGRLERSPAFLRQRQLDIRLRKTDPNRPKN